MVFVNERVSEKDKKNLQPSLFETPYVRNLSDRHFNYWTVDEEKNAFLIFLKGTGTLEIDIFGMQWDGVHFQLGAKKQFIGKENGKSELVWHIEPSYTRIPRNLLESRSKEEVDVLKKDLYNLFESALKVHGFLYETDSFSSVNVVYGK